MLIPLLPEPTQIAIPAIATGLTYEVDLATALETASYKSGAVVWRLHSLPGNNTEVRIRAYRVWPYDPGLVRFQEGPPTTPVVVIETHEATNQSTVGELITTDTTLGTPDKLNSVARRVVLEVKAVGGTTDAVTLTISAAALHYPAT